MGAQGRRVTAVMPTYLAACPCSVICACNIALNNFQLMTACMAMQVLELPEDIFEEAALVTEALHDESNASAGSLSFAPRSHISSGLVAHAVTQLAAGQGTIKLSHVKVRALRYSRVNSERCSAGQPGDCLDAK